MTDRLVYLVRHAETNWQLVNDRHLVEVELLQQRAAVRVGNDRECLHGDQIPSRSTGHVMQRAPPRPRPSSLPGMPMTSMPLSSSMPFVMRLRSYQTTTPGATAR